MRFPDWGDANAPPDLGDVAFQETASGAGDGHLVQRAYRVVGVEERGGRSYRLQMERIAWDEALAALERPPRGPMDPDDPASGIWAFFNLPR